jgi:hypothetical protein
MAPFAVPRHKETLENGGTPEDYADMPGSPPHRGLRVNLSKINGRGKEMQATQISNWKLDIYENTLSSKVDQFDGQVLV